VRVSAAPAPRTAFVLGGGGLLGAYEVGMLQALVEAGVRPDLVVGSSVGAINGAVIASDPTAATVTRLREMWSALGTDAVFGGSLVGQVVTAARTRTHLHDHTALRRLVEAHAPVGLIEELPVPFQCVAASLERASAHWFTAGPITEAVLASASVPGLLPPLRIGAEHFLDGGLVDSIPVGRAVELGATEIYVLQVGRIERELTVPRWPWEVGMVAFEIARRSRYVEEMAALPAHVRAHVLPTGEDSAPLAQLRYRDTSAVAERIERAHRASAAYLREQAGGGATPGPDLAAEAAARD